MATTGMQTDFLEDSTELSQELVQGTAPCQYALPQCRKYKLFLLVVMCCVGGFGLVGNGLSALHFSFEKKTTATTVTLLVMAVVDFCLIIFRVVGTDLPIAAAELGNYEYLYYTDAYVMAYMEPIPQGLHMVTTWLTVMVATQRFVAVCQPYRTKKYTSRQVTGIQMVAVLGFSFAFSLERFLDEEVIETSSGVKIKVYCGLFKDPLYDKVWSGLYNVFMYVIPMVILGVVTVYLVKDLKKRAKLRREWLTDRSNEEDFTLTLVVIIMVFVVCHLFSPIRFVWFQAGNPDTNCDSPFKYFSQLCPVAVVFNSSSNFVVYTMFNKGIREQFLNTFRGIGCKKSCQVTPSIEMLPL